MSSPRIFLSAEWRHLLMLNYEVDPAILAPHVPAGTTLDLFQGRALVSMVGFLFLDTRVLGVPVPGHRNFEEVNLRFYVRREVDGELRRGVVFVREIVPRRAIALVARWLYDEPYSAMPMRHRIETTGEAPSCVEYQWRSQGGWNTMCAEPIGQTYEATPGSEEEFITEHYWGYTKRSRGATSEYQVEHPRWRVLAVERPALNCHVAELYGDAFAEPLAGDPSSAFLADGSAITVRAGVRLAE